MTQKIRGRERAGGFPEKRVGESPLLIGVAALVALLERGGSIVGKLPVEEEDEEDEDSDDGEN